MCVFNNKYSTSFLWSFLWTNEFPLFFEVCIVFPWFITFSTSVSVNSRYVLSMSWMIAELVWVQKGFLALFVLYLISFVHFFYLTFTWLKCLFFTNFPTKSFYFFLLYVSFKTGFKYKLRVSLEKNSWICIAIILK